MKRLLYWLYLLVKRQLKNPVIVVVLIAMPVAALIITNTASFKEKEPVRVGIVLEDDDKIAIIGENEIAITALMQILAGEDEPDEGTVKWGVSTSRSYFPKDNSKYFF